MQRSFDPFTQSVTFHLADGSPLEVSVGELDDFVQYGIKICIVYSSQLGASLALLVLVLLLTKKDKRLSPVFLLNGSALIFNACRLICNCVYFTTEFSKVYPYFSGDYSRVPASAYANSILAVVFQVLLLIAIECSLILQTQVICVTIRQLYKNILLGVSVVISVLAVGFRLGLAVENSIAIVQAANFDAVWLESATNITTIISICFFSCIFIAKLGHAIQRRKKMGIRRFGAMQVIFIMSCQTLVVPSIFAILQYCVEVPEIDSFVLTLVAISLPLTSLWATSLTGNGSQASSGSTERNRLWKPIRLGSAEKLKQSSTSASANLASVATSSPTAAHMTSLCPDLEAGTAVGVKHDVTVTSNNM
ncbi:Suppressor protein stp22 of temperature-sensitive alpha-factor receptor and arginine permease [Paecilomyces lecythidis]